MNVGADDDDGGGAGTSSRTVEFKRLIPNDFAIEID